MFVGNRTELPPPRDGRPHNNRERNIWKILAGFGIALIALATIFGLSYGISYFILDDADEFSLTVTRLAGIFFTGFALSLTYNGVYGLVF